MFPVQLGCSDAEGEGAQETIQAEGQGSQLSIGDPVQAIRAKLEAKGLKFDGLVWTLTEAGIEVEIARVHWRLPEPAVSGQSATAGTAVSDDLLSAKLSGLLERWRALPFHGGVQQQAFLRRIEARWPQLLSRVSIHALELEAKGLQQPIQLTGLEVEFNRSEQGFALQVDGDWQIRASDLSFGGRLDVDAVLDGARAELKASGTLHGGPRWAIDLSDGEQLKVSLLAEDGEARFRLGTASPGPRLLLTLKDLPVSWLGVLRPDADLRSWLKSISGRGRVSAKGAIQFSGRRTRIKFPQLEFSELVVYAPRIAGTVLNFPLEVRDFDLQLGPSQLALRGSWRVDELTGTTKINVSESRASGAIHVDQAACQAWLSSMPSALVPHLAGLRWTGDSAARIAWRVDLEALEALGERLSAVAAGAAEPRWSAPGRIDFDLPLLKRCRVVEEVAIADFEALASGPYRHRLIDADGGLRELVLPRKMPMAQQGTHRIADAFIALEDTKFWRHDGFDREQLQRAFWRNLALGSIAGGASTISQQTAKNLWLGGEQTLSRKLEEAYLTSRLEAKLSKKRILQLYLAIIELDAGVHGVEAAAEHHFGRPLSRLSATEVLHLASLAPAPLTYSRRFAGGEAGMDWQQALQHHRRRVARRARLSTGGWWRGGDPENAKLRLRLRAP